jgi:UDP-GlcNAc:undecaprenyl-phosphate GlcNAc-1-phosphate transferase
MAWIVVGFCAACIVSAALVPIVKWICECLQLTDRPDRRRKLHQHPVALGGGLVAFVSTLAVSLPLLLSSAIAPLPGNNNGLGGLLLASAIIVVLGVADDAVGMRGRQKLLGQMVACIVLLLDGLVIERLQFFGWTVELGLLSTPLTLLWLLLAINAINLLDGINGLVTTVGIIDLFTIAVLAVINDHSGQAVVAAAFAGSLLGFLHFNFPEAKMFLGDAGSMLIGLLIGTLAIQASLKGPGTVLLAAPVCLLTVPLFDSTVAMVRRRLTGRSIFSGDRAHLHHRLTERFGGNAAVGIVAIASGATAAASFASILWRSEIVAVVSALAVVVLFVVSRLFGYAELRLLVASLRSIMRSFLRLNGRSRAAEVQSSVHVQGTREWELIWADLTGAAADLPIHAMELSVNAPMIHEGFHAFWNRHSTDVENIWRFDLPLIAAGHSIGHIRVAGERSLSVSTESLEKVLLLFEAFEAQLEVLFIRPIDNIPIHAVHVPNRPVLAGTTEGVTR